MSFLSERAQIIILSTVTFHHQTNSCTSPRQCDTVCASFSGSTKVQQFADVKCNPQHRNCITSCIKHALTKRNSENIQMIFNQHSQHNLLPTALVFKSLTWRLSAV